MLKIEIILNCMLFVDILLARFVLTAENVLHVQKIPTRISAEILIKFSISWNENIIMSSMHNQYIILL